MSGVQFCQCECYFTRNVFLRKFDIHVVYLNRDQFIREYGKVLESEGCKTISERENVIQEIEQEIARRKTLTKSSQERKLLISKQYIPLHKDIFILNERHLKEEFIRAVEKAKTPGCTREELVELMTSHPDRVYSFPVFQQDFCVKLLEEMRHFEESPLPKSRPNTMNPYGILLNELGFDEGFLTPLREQYLTPLAGVLFPECGGGSLDSHKAFTVTYKLANDDVDLAFHYDNAEVTMNVCLGGSFSYGTLYFGKMRDVPQDRSTCWQFDHQVCHGVFHRGQHKHGALPITKGERYNLIIWMRSSRTRNKKCPMCDETPVLVPVEDGFGDGFTQQT